MQSLTHIDSVVGVTIPCWLSVQNVKQMNTEFFGSMNQPGYESGDQVSRKKTVLTKSHASVPLNMKNISKFN